jgi:GTP-binding protein
VSYALVLTKADELKKSEIEPALEAARAVLAKRPAAFPEIILTSSETGEGISDLREAVVRLLRERGK